MANTDLNVILKLTDQMSSGLARAGASIQRFEHGFHNLGKQIQKTGREMAFVGAGIVTPFAASMAIASKSSFAVANQVALTQKNLEAFNTTLAEAAVPTVKIFNDILGQAVSAFEDLDPALRENIAKWALVTGAVLVASGALLVFTGAVTKLVPILAALGVAFKALEFIKNWKDKGLGAATKQVGDDLQNAMNAIKNAGAAFDPKKFADDMAGMAEKVKNALNGVENPTKKATRAFRELERQGVQAAQQIAASMSQHLGDTLFNALTGKLKGLREVFRAFGLDVLRILTQSVAKFALASTIGKALPFLVFHQGGEIKKAHSGLAPDEVPIIAQSGEGVLSRRGMQALGGSDNLRRLNRGQSAGGGGGGTTIQPVIVVQAWDASDVYRNRKALSAALSHEIKSNGKLRDSIKRYS